MVDYNVFAVLTPYDKVNNALAAFELPHNFKRFRKGVGGVAKEPTIDSREPTPGLADEVVAGIVLTLDEEVKDPENMWQFGTRPGTSDVLLGHRGTVGISAKQCNLTIDDDEHCIWLHDYHSTHGTAVGYNGQKKDEVRRKDTWILSYEPGSEKDLGEITIHVGGLVYKIEFPNHQAAHPEYIKNLRAFIKKCKDAAPPFENLGLDSDPPTQKPSQVHTPSEHAIYLDEDVIGKGAFGEVRRVIKLRDGKYYAAKYFIPPRLKGYKKSDRKRKQDEIDEIDEDYKAWLEHIWREFTIMQNNPHPNIVRVIDFIETTEPALIMELYLGNIKDVGVLYDQYITVFAQILFGLSHLHKNGVAHRDLKPENLLVKKKPLTIAITDFGLSKVKEDDTLLKTFCGTLKHLAPEAFPGFSDSDGYGPEVDIWSAGVIMLEWIYEIADPPVSPAPKKKGQKVTEEQWRDWVAVWIGQLLNKLGDQEADDTVVKILLGMIEPDPKKRWSADRCLKCGLESGLFKMATDGRIVGVDDPDEKDDEDEGDSDDGTNTPIARSPTASLLARPSQGTQANVNVNKTILEGSLWGGRGSTVQPSDRTRRKKHDLDPQHRRRFEVPDLFGSNWLRDPNCVGSDVAALGDDVDEESSRLSNWTSVHSENPSNQGSPREGTEELCMFEGCQPLDEPGKECGQAGMPSREPTDRPTRTVQQLHSEAIAIESSRATHPHNEDERVRPHDINQSVGAVQEIRFRIASRLICATDLIKASSKRRWPASSILGLYETPINTVFVSFVDGLALASRLKLPVERLSDAMDKNLSRISIEISKDEAGEEPSLIVHILPSKSLINATNLLAVRQCRRTQLPNLLDGIHGTQYRAYGMQGTYISYADGLRLCNALEFSEDRLGQIRNAIKEGWLGPLVYVQHEPDVDFKRVKSKMVAEKVANGETDHRKHVQLEEFLLPCAEIPSFTCSTIGDSKKLSRKGGGDDLDDRYCEELDLDDEEFRFYEHSASLPRAAQTFPAQLFGSRDEDQNASRSMMDSTQWV